MIYGKGPGSYQGPATVCFTSVLIPFPTMCLRPVANKLAESDLEVFVKPSKDDLITCKNPRLGEGRPQNSLLPKFLFSFAGQVTIGRLF